MRFWITVFLVLKLVSALHAELVWEQTALTLDAEHGEQEMTGIFRFTNRGPVPVRIVGVHPSCGCTVAKPNRDIFGPGETGELPAKVALDRDRGSRTVSLRIDTDEPSRSIYELSLNIVIPELLKLTPRLMVWKVGEALTPKSVVVKLRDGVKLCEAQAQGGDFLTRLETSTGNEVVLWVTPKTTAQKLQATVKLTVEQENRQMTAAKLFLRVL